VTAVTTGVVLEDDVLALIELPGRSAELILTGRGASERLIDAADLVTEMRLVKHPYDQGVPARRGIEF
jgi:cob(I)alamin adenosyltransferase